MCDPWSLGLELPFVAKLKHKSKRSAWETAEHLKGTVWGISHCILLNLLLSYSSYLYQLLGRLKWAIFSLFYVFFLCHFHFVHTVPCISDRLHVLISPGLIQNRWHHHFANVLLSCRKCCETWVSLAGAKLLCSFYNRASPANFGDDLGHVSWLLDGYGRNQLCSWLVGAGGWMKRGHWESGGIWPQRPPFSWKIALNMGCNYRSPGQYDCL